MAQNFDVTGEVEQFDRKGGWFYLELPDDPGFDLRSMVNDAWPQLLPAMCTVRDTTWRGSIMPIKDGPLFVALTKPVRSAEHIEVGDCVVMHVEMFEH